MTYRGDGLDQKRFDDICTEVKQILTRFRVSRMIVGHTPQASKRREVFCGGRFVVADVTMSRGFRTGGQPMALVLSHKEDVIGSVSLDSMIAHFTHTISGGFNDSKDI